MKIMGKPGLASGIGVGLVLFFCVVKTPSHADELLLVPPELRPTNGLFYSFQNPDHPPLPFNLFADLPLYWVEDDSFLIDDETVDYEELKALYDEAFPRRFTSSNQSTSASSSTNCGELTVPVVTTTWSFWTNVWTNTYHMTTVVGTNVVTNVSHEASFSVQNVPTNTEVDVFGTFYWYAMTNLPACIWYYVGRATNGQEFTVPHGSCPEGWYMAACTNDSDGDGLGDAYELLVSKTSPETNHSVNALFTDGEMDNVLVNGLWQDWGNEQNTQFETTCVVAGTNIIVAWVDSNKGVYGLGGVGSLSSYTPQLVGYAVSQDGGRTFKDMGVPPLSLQGSATADDGDAGDPVLAVDCESGGLYLVGTAPRNDGYKGVPVWKSTNGGVTFSAATNVLDAVQSTDKPWVAVDDWPGDGQHDVYVFISKGRVGTFPDQTNGIWLSISSNGWMTNWSEPILVRRTGAGDAFAAQSVVPVVGPDHVIYTHWLEQDTSLNFSLKMRQVLNRGATLWEVQDIVSLESTGSPNGNLELKRSNTASSNDVFKVPIFPAVGVNPSTNMLGHLYVAYADRGTNANDKADVFLVYSTDGGTNWSDPGRVNADATTNDQWMPVLAVHPDGTQLFTAWYDRRNDTNNGLIEVYGLFADIETNGIVNLTDANEFKISTTSFPMVFAGTRAGPEPAYKDPGHYDPVYPPGRETVTNVSLTWWYPEWPTNDTALDTYADHVGEYNGASADEQHVYLSWTDYRLHAVGSLVPREQSDVRFVRLPWP